MLTGKGAALGSLVGFVSRGARMTSLGALTVVSFGALIGSFGALMGSFGALTGSLTLNFLASGVPELELLSSSSRGLFTGGFAVICGLAGSRAAGGGGFLGRDEGPETGADIGGLGALTAGAACFLTTFFVCESGISSLDSSESVMISFDSGPLAPVLAAGLAAGLEGETLGAVGFFGAETAGFFSTAFFGLFCELDLDMGCDPLIERLSVSGEPAPLVSSAF